MRVANNMKLTPEEFVAKAREESRQFFQTTFESKPRGLHGDPRTSDEWFVYDIVSNRRELITELHDDIRQLEKRRAKPDLSSREKGRISYQIGVKWEMIFREILGSLPEVKVTQGRRHMLCGEIDITCVTNPLCVLGIPNLILVEAKRQSKPAEIRELALFLWKMMLMGVQLGYFFAVDFQQNEDFKQCWQIVITKFDQHKIILFDINDLNDFVSNKRGLREITDEKLTKISQIIQARQKQIIDIDVV